MYMVYITDKKTKAEKVLERNLSKEAAEKVCEAWGWMYTDENNKTYYLNYQEDEDMKNLNEMKVDDLRKLAVKVGVKDYQSKRKDWLVTEILKKQEEQKEAERKEAEKKANKDKKASRGTLYEYDGKALTIGGWSKELGIPEGTLRARIKRLGWTIEDVLTKDSKEKKGNLIEFNGKAQTLGKWSKELNIPMGTLYARINRLGWTPEEALAGKKIETA